LSAIAAKEKSPAGWTLQAIVGFNQLSASNNGFTRQPEPLKESNLQMKSDNLPAAPKSQKMLKLTIAREVEIDGVQMGVMSDGTAYLTGRGLAAMCGVVHSVIQDLTNNWESEQTKAPARNESKIWSLSS
jgi:hypothetical protein